MANFCVGCGKPAAGLAFCPYCGASQSAAQQPPQQQPPQQQQPYAPAQPPQQQYAPQQQYVPPPQPQQQYPVPQQPYAPPPPPQQQYAMPPQPPGKTSGGGAGKIILAIFLVMLALGAIAAGGMLYAGYKIKRKIEQVAAEAGIDTTTMRNPGTAARRVDPCSLLSKDEASAILGVPIERTESSDGTICRYVTAAVSAEDSQKVLERKMEELKNQSPAPGDAAPKAIEEITKAMGAAAAGNGGQLTVSISWQDGRAKMTAMKIALGAMGGNQIPGIRTAIPGIGDEAVMGPMDSILLFTKGATAVELDLRTVPGGREKGIAIARKIVDRL